MATTRRGPRPDPWDKLPSESGPAYEAFLAYRDAGITRSLSKVAAGLHKSKQLLGTWSRKHSWQLRVNSWDREQDRQWQKELAVARRKAAERNIAVAEGMKNLAAGQILRLAQSKENIKAGDIARLMEVAAKIEALALGATTENVALSGGGTASGAEASREHVGVLTDEDRRARMLQLRRQLDSRLDDMGGDDEERAS